jgi:hypothetical protein
MKIKRYNNFSINEKVDQDDKYDIEQILIEFVQDHGFDLEINEMFFNVDKSDYSTKIDTNYKIPALQLFLHKKVSDINISRSKIDNIIDLSYECVGKLGDVFDDVRVNHLSFETGNANIKVKFLVFIKSEVKISDKDGFYIFRDFLINSWGVLNNKVTRSFKLDEVDSESILFKHTDVFGQTNSTLSEFKRLINKIFEPRYYSGFWKDHSGAFTTVRTVYEYECKKEGDDIRVIYKGQKNVDRGGNLIQ